MKNLSALILLIIVLTSCVQTETESEVSELTINIETVNQIYIAGYCSPMDSCRNTPYLLHDSMVETLIDKLNKSTAKASCNFTEEYLLYIHFKDETKREFKIKEQSIKEDNGECFDIHDSDYFENLWIELDQEWIKANQG